KSCYCRLHAPSIPGARREFHESSNRAAIESALRTQDLRKAASKTPSARLLDGFRSTCFARASASAASARSLAATNNLATSLIFLYAITLCSIAPTPLSFGDWGAAPHSMPVAYSVPLNGWELIRGLEFGL